MNRQRETAKRALAAIAWLLVTLLIVGPPAVAIITRLLYGSWPAWSGIGAYTAPTGEFHPPKTTWDIWELLVIPLVLAVGVYWLNKQEREAEREVEKRRAEAEREIAAERERENALQAYLSHMTDLMLEKGLRGSEPDSEIRDIARARTLTVLRVLDGERKGTVIQFLHESMLIKREAVIVDLAGANLSKAVLQLIDLNEVDLSSTNMQESDLAGADFRSANLAWANLVDANLITTDLKGADLSYTKLARANLRFTNLEEAHLYEAQLQAAGLRNANLQGAIVTDIQLAATKSLEGATMPDGTKHK